MQDFVEAAQNKVILTALLAAWTGQVAKPFTSALTGGEFDPLMIVRSGGMPSTHTSGVVAAATCLGLERGFSDPIFGMSVVFAAIVMYDAQGVRYQVGKHAKTLNRFKSVRDQLILSQGKKALEAGYGNSSINSEGPTSISVSGKKASSSVGTNQEPYTVSVLPDTSGRTNAAASSGIDNHKEALLEALDSFVPLNESVGHTTAEVIVGALLGFIVSLTVESILP